MQSVSPGDSMSQFGTSSIGARSTTRPQEYPQTVLWNRADASNDPNVGAGKGNETRFQLGTIIRQADGCLINEDTLDIIKASGRALIAQHLESLATPKDKLAARAKTRTAHWYKSYTKRNWHKVIVEFEQQQPLLGLCSGNWKAEYALTVLIADDNTASNMREIRAAKKASGSSLPKKSSSPKKSRSRNKTKSKQRASNSDLSREASLDLNSAESAVGTPPETIISAADGIGAESAASVTTTEKRRRGESETADALAPPRKKARTPPKTVASGASLFQFTCAPVWKNFTQSLPPRTGSSHHQASVPVGAKLLSLSGSGSSGAPSGAEKIDCGFIITPTSCKFSSRSVISVYLF